jgi:hypothetical protein
MTMAHRYLLMALLSLTMIVSAVSAHAQSDDDRYSIMRPEQPEPWLAPKYKSPRGTPERVVNPPSIAEPQRQTTVPPPIYVPQTGQLLPNMPGLSGSGPRGAETYQDRATRCTHQAGVYGPAAGDRNAYVGGCVNQ